MATNILAAAIALSDQDLLTRLDALAGNERVASGQLVAHLAALDARPAVYAAQGFGSLFSYCRQALRLSEDAACSRIEAARACRSFPIVLDLLASGEMSLTSVRILARHLTRENHRAVLARASGRSRREIEALVAELAPQPDVPTSVRKLPAPVAATRPAAAATSPPTTATPATAAATPTCSGADLTTAGGLPEPPTLMLPAPTAFTPAHRPIVQATAPERYRVQFTIGPDTHEKLRRLQALLRREIPDGDPAAIFDRGLSLLLERVEKAKLGATSGRRAERAIRPCADRKVGKAVSYHRSRPYAKGGPSNVENITLRCWRHNHHEGELIFGLRRTRGEGFVKDSRAATAEGHRTNDPVMGLPNGSPRDRPL